MVARALDVPTESQGQTPHRSADERHIAGRDIMSAAEIAMALGVAIRSGQWWRCICPVHGSRTGHSATLALRNGGRGLIVYCHAGCSTADIFAKLRWRGLLVGRADRPGTTLPAVDRRDHERRIEIARHIWAAGIPGRTAGPAGTAIYPVLPAPKWLLLPRNGGAGRQYRWWPDCDVLEARRFR